MIIKKINNKIINSKYYKEKIWTLKLKNIRRYFSNFQEIKINNKFLELFRW